MAIHLTKEEADELRRRAREAGIPMGEDCETEKDDIEYGS